MIATTPMPVKNFLGVEVKKSFGLKDSDVKAAIKVADDIEKLQQQPSTDEAKRTNDINALLVKLAEEIGKLPISAAAGTNTSIMYGPKYGHHGSSASVGYREAPFPAGSVPMGSSTPVLAKANIRKQGGSPYYIKGHLLNDNLGGPGTTWDNLTPINSKANSDHKTNFENEVKMAVNGALSGSSTTRLGYMKGFTVVANYGRSEPPSLTQLKDDNASTYPPGFDVNNWAEQDVIDILESELHIPLNLVCRATIKPAGATAEKQVSYTVDNEIHYGDLSQYQLGLQPKVPVVLGDVVKANAGAKTEKEMENAFKSAGLKAIGPARAKSIYDTFRAKQRITNGKADIGIGLVALNRLNKGKLISSGSFSGPWPP
jgi:hypothetical protein